MKKEKTIRTYQRRTKSGKVVTVKQHTAKYDAAEALKEAAKKKGAGDELENLKKKTKSEKAKVEKPVEDASDYGFTADEYKAWYHWDQDADPKNKTALKVEKALKKQMGTKAYNKYFDEVSDNYSARGHNKAFKGLSDILSAGAEKKTSTSGKESTGDKKPVTSEKEAKTPKEKSLKVGSSIQMGNSLSSGKGKKETFKVLAVQKTNKQDRELGNTEAAWIQRKDGSVTLALKDSERGWMYDDTWTDLTDRKHPYAKSLVSAGYSLKKEQGEGGKYWKVSKIYDSYRDLKEAYTDYKNSVKDDPSATGKKRANRILLDEIGVSMQEANSKTKSLIMKIQKETGLDISKHKFYGKLPEAKALSDGASKSRVSELSGEKVGNGVAFKDNRAGRAWAKKNGEPVVPFGKEGGTYYKVGNDLYGNITGGHGGTIWGKVGASHAKRLIKMAEDDKKRKEGQRNPTVPTGAAERTKLYKMLTSKETKLWNVPEKYKGFFSAYGNPSSKGKAFVKEYEGSKASKNIGDLAHPTDWSRAMKKK